MKLAKAKEIIALKDTFRVYFYTRKSWSDQRDNTGGYTRDKEDYFPADDEDAFTSLEQASAIAKDFAANTEGEFYDVHVYNLKTKKQVGLTFNLVNPQFRGYRD